MSHSLTCPGAGTDIACNSLFLFPLRIPSLVTKLLSSRVSLRRCDRFLAGAGSHFQLARAVMPSTGQRAFHEATRLETDGEDSFS